MSSAVLAVGAPNIQNTGVLSNIANAVSSINPADILPDAEDALFDRYDSAVDRVIKDVPTSELAMSLPRMAWRVLAFLGTAAALGFSVL